MSSFSSKDCIYDMCLHAPGLGLKVLLDIWSHYVFKNVSIESKPKEEVASFMVGVW